MDYQGLNDITRENHYLLALIKETLNSISKTRYRIKFNITTAFYKIRITKE